MSFICCQERLRRESLERERQSAQLARDEEMREMRRKQVFDVIIMCDLNLSVM